MRLRRPALSFLLLTGLSLGALSPAQAAESPSSKHHGSVAGLVEGVVGAHQAQPAPSTDTSTAPLTEPTTHQEATDTLQQVQGLFDPHVSGGSTTSGQSGDATMALRDLSLRTTALTPAQRVVSARAYDRPWDKDFPASAPKCDPVAKVCVHWISKVDADLYWQQVYNQTGGAVDLRQWVSTDAWAKTVLKDVAQVSEDYTSAHYRHPRSDGTLGNDGNPAYNGFTDVYLTNPGADGQYGYCTVDGTLTSSGGFRPTFAPTNTHSSDLPAFCVLDNNYSEPGFQNHTPEDDLKVTAAHEYFHAVQFAYDYLEDRWFMEATATWAEDQVYTGINDNLQYLRTSQLRHPGTSLDDNQALGGFLHYGDWIYFRYLTERLPARTGPLMPTLMLQMWQRADSVTGPDQYSIQAVARTLAAHHVSFPQMFAQYAAADRHPATAYSEGRANHYPTARPKRTAKLSPGKRRASGSTNVNHLASTTIRFVPKRLARKRRLAVTVNMADRRTGSVATVVVFYKSGRVTTKLIRLDRHGNGRTGVPFAARSISAVDLTLVNANIRYKHCSGNIDGFSCGGVPMRDHVTEKYAVRVR